MMTPDSTQLKKKQQLIDKILALKKDSYAEARDKLVSLQCTLQNCRQKTKIKDDAINELKQMKKENFDKYINSYVEIAYAKADIMILNESKESIFGIKENVCIHTMIIYIIPTC